MEENIYKRIVDTWGTESQLNMVIEEVGELLQAISKFNRAKNKDEETQVEAYRHLCEEVADVINMMNQMREMFSSELIDKYIKEKLDRTEEKLNKDIKSEKEI